jgi:hypothetical protein
MLLGPSSPQQGGGVAVELQLSVRRESVLEDLLDALRGIIADDPTTLLLPLR